MSIALTLHQGNFSLQKQMEILIANYNRSIAVESPAPTKASHNTTLTPEDHCGRGGKTKGPDEQEVCCEAVSPGIDRKATAMKSHHHGCLNTG